MSEPLLQVSQLSLSVGRREPVDILRDISFTVDRDETVGIVGESGSGKSMTVRTLMRLLPDNANTTGSVRFEDNDILGMRPAALREYRRTRVGMIFQDPHAALDPVRRIGDFLTEPARGQSAKVRRQALEASVELLADVGIKDPEDVVHRYPHELSGGMLQRVMIASVMSARPHLILADEPTTALDVTTQSDILALLSEVRAAQRSAMILISHDIELVAAVCTRILVMYRGRIIESLSPAELLAGDAKEPYTRALLACRPTIEQRLPRLPVIDETEWGARYA